MASRNAQNAAEKRRLILDAAVRVFARQGFNQCRVSDIADEAGVAYGLVYHYFRSKDEVLDTLFLERWDVLLDVIRDLDARDLPAREKLHAIASFIIDSYRHDPDLMKVIIVEVTRAANSFGATHLDRIQQAYALIAQITEKAQADGEFKDAVTPPVRRDGVLRRDRAGAHGLDLRRPPGRGDRPGAGQGLHRRDDLLRPRARARAHLSGGHRGRQRPSAAHGSTTRSRPPQSTPPARSKTHRPRTCGTPARRAKVTMASGWPKLV